MIEIGPFVRALDQLGTSFYTGVPCSYLNSFMNYAASGQIRYVAAASEGEAVGIATGAWLAGGPAAVLIQNSGLGNCINPITSLSITFEIPFLLLVSHRGEGGQDAPQHLHMGDIMYDLLGAVGVPAYTLPDSTDAAIEMLEESYAKMLSTMRPVALVARKGVFEPHSLSVEVAPKTRRDAGPLVAAPREVKRVARVDALREIGKVLAPDDLVVATTGMTARELCAVGDRDANFYMMGSMGCAPAIGLGVALERPARKLVVIDGDGAFLMKMGVAATIGSYAPPGLIHVVLDNGTYETTGSQPTTSPTVAFEQVAHAAGYARAVRADSPQELAALIDAFVPGDGPVFCCLRILDGHMEKVPRVDPSPRQIRDRFREAALS